MLYPSIDKILNIVDSKYRLVNMRRRLYEEGYFSRW